jgi:signal transduction histidine kinase
MRMGDAPGRLALMGRAQPLIIIWKAISDLVWEPFPMDAPRAHHKILLVDDMPGNIKVLNEILSPDYQILFATDGMRALKLATAEQPDLILLDIIMPGMDGYELCRQLKSNQKTHNIPIIFITAKDADEDETQGLALGAVDYITKPVQPAILRARVKSHLDLQSQKTRLIELNELKNRFLGMAAHDLKNPLGTIHGMSEVLLEEHDRLDSEERQLFLHTIYRVSEQMLKLVNDLLNVSVIESGKFELVMHPTDLNALVEMRLRLFAPMAEKKGIHIVTSLGVLPRVPLDEDRFGQVIDNLLSNAIKFSPPCMQITLTTHADTHSADFSVADQGPGIPVEEHGQLFQPFQKLSPKGTAGEKSTGLGLAIVKKIVDAHQGTITLVNPSDGGARFTVRLPLPPT